MQTYDLGRHGNGPLEIDKQANITCRLCNMTSYHPEDIRHRYCGHCHIFHDQLDHWLDMTKDEHPEVAKGFLYVVDIEIMKSLPADSQAGLRKLLRAAYRPTMWERLLNRGV